MKKIAQDKLPPFSPKKRVSRDAPPIGAPPAPGASKSPATSKFGPPPGATEKPPTSTQTSSTSKIRTKANPAVRQMQQAILNFANVASGTDVTSLQGNQSGRMEGDQTTGPLPSHGVSPLSPEERAVQNIKEPENSEVSNKPREPAQFSQNETPSKSSKKYLGGSDPFGNFIVNTYIPKNITSGRQYLNVDAVGKSRELASMAPVNLRGIIDSIKRIGTPGIPGEKTAADGIWGQRTNNSLHLIAALTEAMLNFIRDTQIDVPGYTTDKLAEFKSEIPDSHQNLKNVTETAQKLSAHIVEMTKFFENLKPAVFNNRDLRQYIDQKKSFEKYDAVPQIPITEESKPIPGAGVDWVTNENGRRVTLKDISDFDSFKNYVSNLGLDANDPKMRDSVIKSLYKSMQTAQATSTRK